MARIGIYPGTFDPLHEGHIAFALKAIEVCTLDQVVFLPETTPRGKTGVTEVQARVKQLEQAFEPYPTLSVFLAQPSPFTVSQTLPELQEAFPDTEMTLLVGSDVYAHIHEWPDISSLLESVTIVIGLRHGDAPTANTVTDSAIFIELPETAHLSSTTHRGQISR